MGFGSAVAMNTETARHVRYHHGDLTKALTEAATDLARVGGPEAIVLREAARRVGVSATAAYRHFAGHTDLLLSVKRHAQTELAAAMRAELSSRSEQAGQPLEFAPTLTALGWGYLAFARAEPGLFRTAYHRIGHGTTARDDTRSPYQLLSAAFDRLTDPYRLSGAARTRAETATWAAVHGLAILVVDGPLATVPEPECQQMLVSTVDILVRGIAG
jgi:AcrR family transcriptional regulator